MKKIIFLAMIGATLGLVSCANQGTTTTSNTPPGYAEQGVAAGGLSGGGGGSPQMRHTPTKNLP